MFSRKLIKLGCRRRGRRGRDRRLRDRQLEFQQRRIGHGEHGTCGRAGPGAQIYRPEPGASIRPSPAELASRDRDDHRGSGSRQGQGRRGCQAGGNRQPCAEAQRRLLRRPQDRHPCPAPRVRQQGLRGHRHRVGRCPARAARADRRRGRCTAVRDDGLMCSGQGTLIETSAPPLGSSCVPGAGVLSKGPARWGAIHS
jgi:hypothetical protein